MPYFFLSPRLLFFLFLWFPSFSLSLSLSLSFPFLSIFTSCFGVRSPTCTSRIPVLGAALLWAYFVVFFFLVFCFRVLSGLFLFFFPGTCFGAAPWEARCCFEQCRIRSHKGFFVQRIKMARRELASKGKSSPKKNGSTHVSPMKKNWITNTKVFPQRFLEPKEHQCQGKLEKKFSQKYHHRFLNSLHIYRPNVKPHRRKVS